MIYVSTISRKIAQSLVKLKYDNLPKEVQDKAKACIYDALACAIEGHQLDWCREAAEMVQEFGAREESAIWVRGIKTTAPYAAYVNSVMSHSVIHEDMHTTTGAHPGPVVMPTVMALGEKINATGKEIITSIVAGYEIIGQLGRVLSAPVLGARGLRPSSIFGTFGSTAAACKMLGLSEDETVNAIGLAGGYSSGLNEWAFSQTDDIYFQMGNACYNGIISTYLARRGFKFADSIVEGKAGLCNCFAGTTEVDSGLITDCVDKFEIMNVIFKPVPACGLVQTTGQLALKIAQSGLDYKDIKEGVIKTSYLGKYYPGCDDAGPFKCMTQARMSNQYTFAAALYKSAITNEMYLRFTDEDINELAKKFTVEVDDECNSVFPRQHLIKAELFMNDGTCLIFKQEDVNYNAAPDIINKFMASGSRVLGRQKTQAICDAIDNFENLDSVANFISLIKL